MLQTKSSYEKLVQHITSPTVAWNEPESLTKAALNASPIIP